MILTGVCLQNCENADQIAYNYNIYKYWYIANTIDIQEKWFPFSADNSSYVGENSLDLTVFSVAFQNNTDTTIWKFKLDITTISSTNGISTGSSSLIIFINRMPKNGSCSITPLNGVVLNTDFTIVCQNWYDSDGSIQRYNYYAGLLDDQMKIGLGYSYSGSLTTQLPQGAVYDSNRLYIDIEIVDNDNGITYYSITTPVTVNSNVTQLQNIMNQLISLDPLSQQNLILFDGNSLKSIQTLLALSSLLNMQSLSDKKSLMSNSSYSQTMLLTQIYGPLSNFNGVATFNASLDLVAFENRRNQRSNTRDALISFVNNISISDMNSIRSQASMLAMLTSQTDEVTRKSADSVTNQCIRLTQALNKFTSSSSVEELKQAVVSIASLIGNVNSGLSIYLNKRDTYINSDYNSAVDLPMYYDTDVENFWTNPNSFNANGDSQEAMDKNINIQRQKFQIVDNQQKSSSILDALTSTLSQHFYLGESFHIQTPSLSVFTSKLLSQNMPSQLQVENSLVELPTFCQMTSSCSHQEVTFKLISQPMAFTGHNGDNETFIGYSSTMDLAFYSANSQHIRVANSSPISFWIPRNLTNSAMFTFQHVNATNLSVASNLVFLPNAFNVTANNASIQIHIRPFDFTKAYLVLLKFGYTPIVNTTYADYDYMKTLCSNSSIKINICFN